MSHCLGLVFYGQLLEQLSVALLSRPTVFSVLLIVIYCGQINDDDDDDKSLKMHHFVNVENSYLN